MKLLVTGGAGYIGSVVAGHLLEAGHDVTVVDDLSTGHRDAVPPGARFVEADVAETDPVLAEGGYAGVLHFAAKSLVAESTRDPGLYWRTNVGGSRALLDAMRRHEVGTIVFSSTAATYGQPDSVPITEAAPTRPTSPYGTSKLAVDLMLADEARAHGLAAVSLRYFNVAGAWQGLGERHTHETHLIPLALQAALGHRDAIEIYGDDHPTIDGTCVRDYIHVADLARAHVLALAAARAGEHQIFNLGTETGSTVGEVLDVVDRVTGIDLPRRVVGRRPGDPAALVASSARMRQVTGWRPERGLTEAVEDAWRCLRVEAADPTGNSSSSSQRIVRHVPAGEGEK
jgi:UDP-glucose 4-epimerase